MSTGQMLQGWTKILCKKFLLVHIVIKNNHKNFRINWTTYKYAQDVGKVPYTKVPVVGAQNFCPSLQHLSS